MNAKRDGIGLADALEALRAELALARAKAAEKDVRFPIETFDCRVAGGCGTRTGLMTAAGSWATTTFPSARSRLAQTGSVDGHRAASWRSTNATLPYVRRLASMGVDAALAQDPGFARGLNIKNGEITYEPVAEAFAQARPVAAS